MIGRRTRVYDTDFQPEVDYKLVKEREEKLFSIQLGENFLLKQFH